MKASIKGAVVASAVMSMLSAGAAFAGDKAAKEGGAAVKCQGANDCKGKGGCKSAANECKGKNGCKGQGVTSVKSEKDCTDKGGKVM